jgi:hypothetical protein
MAQLGYSKEGITFQSFDSHLCQLDIDCFQQ